MMMICFPKCIALAAPSCPAVLDYIQKNLPQSGVLKYSGGFVYVDVDDEYIRALVKFIQKDGFVEPPYFGSPDAAGAHITVIYPEEITKYGVEKIDECGETIDFIPKKCQVVRPPQMQDIDEVYFIVVEAPELDLIRKKYDLPKREYDFHITTGVKPKITKSP